MRFLYTKMRTIPPVEERGAVCHCPLLLRFDGKVESTPTVGWWRWKSGAQPASLDMKCCKSKELLHLWRLGRVDARRARHRSGARWWTCRPARMVSNGPLTLLVSVHIHTLLETSPVLVLFPKAIVLLQRDISKIRPL